MLTEKIHNYTIAAIEKGTKLRGLERLERLYFKGMSCIPHAVQFSKVELNIGKWHLK